MTSLLDIQSLLDATARNIIAVDPAGVIVQLSNKAQKELQLSLRSSLEEDFPAFWIQIRKVLSAEQECCETPVQINGREYLAGVNPIVTPDGIQGALCILVDSSQLDTMTRRLPSFNTLSRELDTIIDSSSDGLFVCDADANVIRMNPASEKIHNLAASEIVGRNMRELLSSGFIDRSAALETSITHKPASLLQKKDGRTLVSIATPVFDDSGKLVRVVVSERDISEIDRLQRELEQQEAIRDGFRDQILEMQKNDLEAQQIIARSPAMVRSLQQALRVAKADSSVLILGESGVGKGLLADIIHKNSARSGNPLIKINCGAIPESLIEAELFGYERGAFTGAQNRKPGHFELADGGTLFLDEIAELPLPSQVKLLRFLEDGQITRLGDTNSRKVNVRVLAATHQDMDQLVKLGKFRLDLYYRLNVIPIQVPAVRERQDCIVPLIHHYIEKFSARSGSKKRLTKAALDSLAAYPFPGNVRELMNICERLVVMSDTESIGLSDLPPQIQAHSAQNALEIPELDEGATLQETLDRVEKHLLETALTRFRNQTDMAAALGVNQSTIARKLKKHSLG